MASTPMVNWFPSCVILSGWVLASVPSLTQTIQSPLASGAAPENTMLWLIRPINLGLLPACSKELFVSLTVPPSVPSVLNNPILSSPRSEEHTSELQSRPHLVCRLLLE